MSDGESSGHGKRGHHDGAHRGMPAGRLGAFAAGLIFGVFGREVLPRLMNTARPYVKEGIKVGLAMSDRTRLVSAELREGWDDLYAEAVSEYREVHDRPAGEAE